MLCTIPVQSIATDKRELLSKWFHVNLQCAQTLNKTMAKRNWCIQLNAAIQHQFRFSQINKESFAETERADLSRRFSSLRNLFDFSSLRGENALHEHLKNFALIYVFFIQRKLSSPLLATSCHCFFKVPISTQCLYGWKIMRFLHIFSKM